MAAQRNAWELLSPDLASRYEHLRKLSELRCSIVPAVRCN